MKKQQATGVVRFSDVLEALKAEGLARRRPAEYECTEYVDYLLDTVFAALDAVYPDGFDTLDDLATEMLTMENAVENSTGCNLRDPKERLAFITGMEYAGKRAKR